MSNQAIVTETHQAPKHPGRPPAVIVAATRLLDSARRFLARDRVEAARCISEAADLLRSGTEDGRADASAPGPLASWQVNRVVQLFEKNLAGSPSAPPVAAA